MADELNPRVDPLTDAAPPVAPLDMPRQSLERTRPDRLRPPLSAPLPDPQG